jgi:hypothetical protein
VELFVGLKGSIDNRYENYTMQSLLSLSVQIGMPLLC